MNNFAAIPGLKVTNKIGINPHGYVAYDDTIDNIVKALGMSHEHMANPFIDKRELVDRIIADGHDIQSIIDDMCTSTMRIYYCQDTIDMMVQYAATDEQKRALRRKVKPVFPAYVSAYDISRPSCDWMTDMECLADNYWHHKRALSRRVLEHWTKNIYDVGGLKYHSLCP